MLFTVGMIIIVICFLFDRRRVINENRSLKARQKQLADTVQFQEKEIKKLTLIVDRHGKSKKY